MLKQHPIVRFFASLKLAVFSILLLAAVLTLGTIVESLFGMRGAKVLVYGTWWFGGVLFLLGINVIFAALVRYPWKKHQTGFVVTHLGIIVLLVGSVMTQKWGTDGSLPVREGSENNEVVLHDLRFTVWDEQTNVRRDFPLRETARESKDRMLTVSLNDTTNLVVKGFIPRAMPEKKIRQSHFGIGVPALKVELYNSRFKVDEWLLHRHPDKAAELNLGPAVLSFEKLWADGGEKEFFARSESSGSQKKSSIGTLILQQDGKEFRMPIDPFLKRWGRVAGSHLELFIERYLPYAIVEKGELVSRSQEPQNPAVQLLLRDGSGRTEKHTVFAFFPEFTTMHKSHAGATKGSPFGVTLKMISASQNNESLAIVGNRRGRLLFAQSADNQKLFYRSLSSSGQLNGQGEVTPQQEMKTGWMDLQFKVVEWIPSAVEEEVPRSVDYISGGDANFLTSAQVVLEEKGAAASEPQWIMEGEVRNFSVGGKKIAVQLGKTQTSLPFQIFLKKFTIGTDPGTTKAASYASEVTVKDPARGVDHTQLISMNEPLEYAGFTFYQASYQLPEGQPPISVFSVNQDPGRWVKYLGSLLICLGATLMFYMNPHYWGILFGKRKQETNK